MSGDPFAEVKQVRNEFNDKKRKAQEVARLMEVVETRLKRLSMAPGFVEIDEIGSSRYAYRAEVYYNAYFDEISERLLKEVDSDFWNITTIDKKQGGPGTYRVRLSLNTKK